ncbi:RecQ family ATP-dependent DNA helicase [Taibaiella koreensis]|uniref:RecQ family ATP-dependent DNA helicase n=1 Tax=Taibaiella koreensis TaxID=1268548 RepID=UPI000E5A09C6|nr:RecQ family ATP-dependent DNA helicase [Taibaiella koreensis]
MSLIKDLLQQYWHYSAFRPLQEEVIDTVIDGGNALALLPTGGGKSLCYQLPALAQQGFCLVVSPLVALMQDQVMQLDRRGIPAAFLHSGMAGRQMNTVLQQAAAGELKLLYVSPERLQTAAFEEYCDTFQLNLIAVDEAHCIAQWGHDFRPAYRRIGTLRERFPSVPVLALTASANEEVQLDIIRQLRLGTPAVFRQSVVRENLFYHIRYTENKPGDTETWLHKVTGSGILYCRSRKRCVETAIRLRQEGFDAGVYHAGMPREEREQAQRQWTASVQKIMCATTAFGMGIDKPDVRTVVHYDAPEHIEAYYQEAGRAGRDGLKAHAVLLYDHKDIIRLQESTEINYPPEAYIRKVYHLVGDYLKMPVGEGMEQLQAFDAVAFAHAFELETLKTLSAIRLLDREGFWQWNENANMQTLVQFTTDRRTLNYLENTEPKLSYVATSLLRLYGSIFHYPTVIREFEVSKLLRIEKPQLDLALQRLSALGIIAYQPAVTGGTLYWMHHRFAPAQLRLDTRHIDQLRQAHERRVQKMIAYIQNEETCRNVLLAQYFGESSPQPCGGCDVCRRKAQHPPAKDIREQILALIREQQQISIAGLTAAFPGTAAEHVIEYVRLLHDESLCRVYPTGIIFAT